MKKLVSVLLAILLMVPAAGLSETDISSMSLEELLSLNKEVVAAITKHADWKEVTVPPGAYEIGNDIPAGYWTITATSGKTAEIYGGSKLNSSRTGIESGESFAFEQITDPKDSYSKYNDITSVSWDLREGDCIVVESSSVIFTPFIKQPLGF